jgi:hypothetical protein
MSERWMVGVYFGLGLILAAMYIAVRVETLRFPRNILEAFLVVVSTPAFALTASFLSEGDLLSILTYIFVIEIVSLLISMVLMLITGGTVNRRSDIIRELKVLARNPFKQLRKNIAPLLWVFFFLVGLLFLTLLILQDSVVALTAGGWLSVVAGVGLNVIEYIRNIYRPYRNRVNYSVLVIISMFIWFGTFIASGIIFDK